MLAWRLQREGRATVKPACKAKRFSTRSQPVFVFLILIDDGCISGCFYWVGHFLLVLAGNSNIKLGSADEEGWEENMRNEEKEGVRKQT